MGAKLLYRDAQGRDASVDLPPEGAYLGRAVDCVVRTDDAMVSRKNCKISFLGGRWYVEDLNSANGTYANDRRIQKEVVSHGDVIRCGSLQVRFVQVADDPMSPAGMAPVQVRPQSQGLPSENTGHVPAQRVDGLLDPTGQPQALDRRTQGTPLVPAGGGPVAGPGAMSMGLPLPGTAPSQGSAQVLRLRDEELKKAAEELKKITEDRDAAIKDAADAKQQLEAAAGKIDAMEQEQKRLRNDFVSARDALDKQRRQSQQDEQELQAQTKVNEELRKERLQLKEQLGKALSAVEDMKVQIEGRDRQIATAADEVRRAKQAADSLTLRLQEVTKERDAHVRAINDQRGDVEHLREILKERERMLEEKRVGLINLESQVKDLRQRADGLEKDLLATRSERDGLRERFSKAQIQMEEMRAEIDRLGHAVAGQQDGGQQIVQLSRENSELRQQVQAQEAQLKEMQEHVDQANTALDQVAALQAQVKKMDEEQKAARQKLKDSAQDAVNKAVQEVTDKFKARMDDEQAHWNDERQRLINERDAAMTAQAAAAPVPYHSDQVQAVETERDALKGQLADAEHRQHEVEGKLADLEARLRKAEAQAAEAEAEAEKLRKAAHEAPTPAPATVPDAGGEAKMAEIKAVAATAYDGINDFLSDFKVQIVMAQESFERLERTIPDREAARKLREAFEAAMDKFSEAKGHVRSLLPLIE